MSEGWVKGQMAIIAYLKNALNLSDDFQTAWNKVERWRNKYGMKHLFHRLPNGTVYVVKDEVEQYFKKLSKTM